MNTKKSYTKQELLLGRQAIQENFITLEQLKRCLEVQKKEPKPLLLVFIDTGLLQEEQVKLLLHKHIETCSKEDGEDLVLCRLILREELVPADKLKNLLDQKNDTSLAETILNNQLIDLKTFIEIYSQIYEQTVSCKKCSKNFRLINLSPGKKVRCKHCKSIIKVPSIEDELEPFEDTQYLNNESETSPLEQVQEEQEVENIEQNNESLPIENEFAGYELLDEIAQGGMGIIFKIQKRETGQIMAMKVLREIFRESPEANKRFEREASTLSRLQHPNIISVTDVGIEKKIPYFVMEYIEGESLADYIEDQLLPVEEVIAIIIKICDGLQYAHNEKIIHRDIKPSNILLDKNKEPKITDFGLAKCIDSLVILTHSGSMFGTPYYMSPEQARGQLGLIGPRSDIYALGVVFYQMLTGVNPFKGENTVEIYQNILTIDPLPPSQFNPTINKRLDSICLKCLKKDTFQRYNTPLELKQALENYQTNRFSFWQNIADNFLNFFKTRCCFRKK